MSLPVLQEQGGALSGLVQGLGLGLQQAMPSISEMILNKQKQNQKADLLSGLRASGGEFGVDDLLKMSAVGLDKEAAIMAPFVLAEQKTKLKEASEQKEKSEARQELVPASTRLESMINHLGAQPGNLEMSEELDTLGFWYTDKIYTHFNKGVINKEKFKNMKDELAPNSKLTPRENRARLKSLNTIAGLDPNVSSKDFDRVLDREVKKVKKLSQGRGVSGKSSKNQLTDEVVVQILEEAGGDPAKATEIAKERGYEF
jgi:hypothetical protein